MKHSPFGENTCFTLATEVYYSLWVFIRTTILLGAVKTDKPLADV